jgi:ParB family chromosome partitioning protein
MPSGLGRGLSALIPGAPVPEPPRTDRDDPSVRTVPVERIHPNPLQPRREFPVEELASLAASIQTHGMLQPLVVTVRPDNTYELVAGERRLRAAKLAGLVEVPVVIRVEEHDDRAKLELALVENIQREDLNPIDRAIAFRQLQNEFGLTQEAIAARVGIARSSVAHALRLLVLPADIQAAVQRGELSEGHAKLLAGMDDPAEQRAWFERIREQRLPLATVASATTAAGVRRRGRPPGSGRKGLDPNTHAKELELQRQLGAKVRIAPRTTGGGTITIEYTDAEELEGIMRTLLE